MFFSVKIERALLVETRLVGIRQIYSQPSFGAFINISLLEDLHYDGGFTIMSVYTTLPQVAAFGEPPREDGGHGKELRPE